MPLTHSMATRLGKKLTDVRKSGLLWWLRPDGKTQVTIEYLQKADGSVEPKKIHTIVISTQHAEPLKATRCKECAGYTGADETAPSMEDMNKLITEEVIKKTLEEITLKNGQSALTLYGDHTHLHINPFVRSSSIPTAAGERTEEALSPVRIQLRLTALLLMLAVKWQSQLSRAVSASVLWSSCLMPLVLQN